MSPAVSRRMSGMISYYEENKVSDVHCCDIIEKSASLDEPRTAEEDLGKTSEVKEKVCILRSINWAQVFFFFHSW